MVITSPSPIGYTARRRDYTGCRLAGCRVQGVLQPGTRPNGKPATCNLPTCNHQGAPMIIDSHCHAWPRWPYQPPVPDDESRGRVEQLLNEMDLHGVDQAVVICARIERNPDNNDYIAEQARRYADRLHQFPD